MDGVGMLALAVAIAVVIGGAYLLARLIRARVRHASAEPLDQGFRPRIGFTRLDGMASLALILSNESPRFVWVEEIEIAIGDLEAKQQAEHPTFREVQKVAQMIGPGDVVPISVMEAIYTAAGRPQLSYSCLLSARLRYRVGEERLEKNLDAYRVRLMGLSVSRIQRERATTSVPASTAVVGSGLPELEPRLK